MDSLTTHYLARELDARWRGRRVAAAALRDDPRAVLLHVDGTDAIALDLSTREPCARWDDAPRDALHLAGWTVRGVESPTDERRLTIALERPGRFRGSPTKRAALEVSVVPSARGATLRDAGGTVLAAVGARPPRPKAPRPELGADDVMRAVTAGDTEALLRGRWMSAHVIDWLMAEPERAAERYRMLAALPDAEPSVCGERVLPLPLCATPARTDSLIRARVESPGMDATAPSPRSRVLARMREELARAREAPRLREAADRLLLLGDAAAPATVELGDRTAVAVEPRAGENALRAAERLYKAARSLERAADRLPARIAELEARAGRDGDRPRRQAPPTRARKGQGRALPYRTYVSSGGLDILVGRGAQANDALTFKVAAPDDVWMHARGASGAHVVLRWTRPEPPPARDLEEAAVLAAWHSKARGSAVVPVDWTRRKHVRRARGESAGRVLVNRAETIMARPSEEKERALRRSPND